jgi:uncharacterized protein YfcZ (UPF0381/DUF406 family)
VIEKKNASMASRSSKTQADCASTRGEIERLLPEGDVAQIYSLFDALSARAESEAARAESEAARAESEAARATEFVEQADQLGERVRGLDLRVKQLTRLLYGRRSEKLSRENLAQLVLAFGGEDAGASDPDVPTPSSPDDQEAIATAA